MYNTIAYIGKIILVKIGGSCLVGAESFRHMARRIREVKKEGFSSIVIVLSAFYGMTTKLEEYFEKSWGMSLDERKSYAIRCATELAVSIRQKYIIPLYSMTSIDKKSVVLATEAEVNKLCDELVLRLCMHHDERKDICRAKVVAFGEECTVAIVRFVLEQVHNMTLEYMHASKLITTAHPQDDYCIDATIAMSSTEQKVKLYAWKIAQYPRPMLIEGFIGENVHHMQTILEREGSDVTAAALARAFVNLRWDVPFVRYYKNVGGIWKHEPSLGEIAQGDGFEERMMLKELLGITIKAKQKVICPDAVRLLIGNGTTDARIPAQVALFSTGVVGTKLY